MQVILYRLLLTFGLVVTLPTYAASYICKVDGGILFTEKKVGNECTLSHADGSAQVTDEEAEKAVPEKVNLKEAPGFAAPDSSDVKILPRTGSGSVMNSADAANPRMDIKLRNGSKNTRGTDAKSAAARAAELNRRAKIIPAPVTDAKAKPQLTRKQVLQNEIRNEQAALARVKVQLNVARKKGDTAKVSRLSQALSDREANIRAIQGEMNR